MTYNGNITMPIRELNFTKNLFMSEFGNYLPLMNDEQ